MILSQIAHIGKVAMDMEGLSKFEIEISLLNPYEVNHIVEMHIDETKLDFRSKEKSLDPLIQFKLSDYKPEDFSHLLIDKPSGASRNNSPIIVWYEGKKKDSEKKIHENRITKVLNSVNLNKETLKLVKERNTLKSDELWFENYLTWVQDTCEDITKALESFMSKNCKTLTKKELKQLVIVPKFHFSDGRILWPGQIDLIKKIYLKNTQPDLKKKTQLRCMVCKNLEIIPIEPTKANVTGWYTLDQLAFHMFFFNSSNNAAPICSKCLNQVRKGLDVVHSFGEKFSIGFGVKEGKNFFKIYQMIIPIAQDVKYLQNFIDYMQDLTPQNLLNKIEEIDGHLAKSDIIENQGFSQKGEDTDEMERIDLSYLFDDNELINNSLIIIHYLKEKSGGKHRLIHISLSAREHLESISKNKHQTLLEYGSKVLNFKKLFFLVATNRKEKSSENESSIYSRYFYYLNALLSAKPINRHKFLRECQKSLKKDFQNLLALEIKNQLDEVGQNNYYLKQNWLRRLILDFKIFYTLFQKLDLINCIEVE